MRLSRFSYGYTGIHSSMAGRAIKLVMSLGVSGPVLITGGLGADQGLVAAMRECAVGQKMAVEVRSHPQSILAGAGGGGLGAFRVRKLRTLELKAS